MCFNLNKKKKSKIVKSENTGKEEPEIIINIVKQELPTIFHNGKDLVVDDSDQNLMVIRKYLERFGRQVDEAINGLDAIEKIKEKGTYDLLFIDIQMPKMNGIKATEFLRKELNYQGIIIGLTGHVDEDSINDCKRAGMNEIIAKPIDKKILEVYIEKYCGTNITK